MCYFLILILLKEAWIFCRICYIPTPIFGGLGRVQFSFSPWTFTERTLPCTWETCSKDLFWFVSFQDSKWWVYSFCYCWLLGNFLLRETCVYVGVCMRVFYKIPWARYMFVFCFFLRSWFRPPPPPGPARFKVVVKNLSCLCLKRSAGGNSKGLPCQYHRYCVCLEQTVLQLQRAARSTVLLALELSFEEEEEEKGEIFLSSLLPFFLKANAVQNHSTVGLGLFIQNCQFPYLNIGWGFFPSYSSLNEGDSCFFYVSLLKERCEGKIIFQIPQVLTPNVWTRSSFQRSGCSEPWLWESFRQLIKLQTSS